MLVVKSLSRLEKITKVWNFSKGENIENGVNQPEMKRKKIIFGKGGRTLYCAVHLQIMF